MVASVWMLNTMLSQREMIKVSIFNQFLMEKNHSRFRLSLNQFLWKDSENFMKLRNKKAKSVSKRPDLPKRKPKSLSRKSATSKSSRLLNRNRTLHNSKYTLRPLILVFIDLKRISMHQWQSYRFIIRNLWTTLDSIHSLTTRCSLEMKISSFSFSHSSTLWEWWILLKPKMKRPKLLIVCIKLMQ